MIDILNWYNHQDKDTKIAFYFLSLVFMVSISLIAILGVDRYSRYKIRELDVKIMEMKTGRK
jgi:hypothetical protein